MTPGTVPLAPTSKGRRFVKYLVGFGVGVAVGVAPFVGMVEVPAFSPLLALFPLEMQGSLITLSGFLLGMVAVAVQYYSTRAASAAQGARYFGKVLVSLLAAFLLLIGLYEGFVISIDVPTRDPGAVAQHDPAAVPKRAPVAFVKGWSRSRRCGCDAELSDSQCIGRLSLNPAALDTCWNHRGLIKLALTLTYLAVLGGFGALVGLVLLREEEDDGRARRQAAMPGRRRSRRAAAAPGSSAETRDPGGD